MIYQFKNNRVKKFKVTRKLLTICVLAIFGILLFGNNPMQNFFAHLFAPFLQTGGQIYESSSQAPNWFSEKTKLIEDIKRLTEENTDLKIKLGEFASLNFENLRLKEDLKINFEENTSYASVIARSPQMPLDSLFINKGASDGVRVGDLVLGGEKSLIGKVGKVFNRSAIVLLYSGANQSESGFIARTNEPIEVKGAGGGNLTAETPSDFDIRTGDAILFSYVKDYILAVVGSIETDTAVGQKTIRMSLPLNTQRLKSVFILPVLPLPE